MRVWRAYFNRGKGKPDSWSIYHQSAEHKVTAFHLQGCQLESHNGHLAISAYELEIKNGVAIFS